MSKRFLMLALFLSICARRASADDLEWGEPGGFHSGSAKGVIVTKNVVADEQSFSFLRPKGGELITDSVWEPVHGKVRMRQSTPDERLKLVASWSRLVVTAQLEQAAGPALHLLSPVVQYPLPQNFLYTGNWPTVGGAFVHLGTNSRNARKISFNQFKHISILDNAGDLAKPIDIKMRWKDGRESRELLLRRWDYNHGAGDSARLVGYESPSLKLVDIPIDGLTSISLNMPAIPADGWQPDGRGSKTLPTKRIPAPAIPD